MDMANERELHDNNKDGGRRHNNKLGFPGDTRASSAFPKGATARDNKYHSTTMME
jgi:hypothetical protein